MPAPSHAHSAAALTTIASGELAAAFLPRRGMLGTSVRFRDIEMLRRIEDLESAAAKGSTAGIPLLYPWANRLAGFHYRAAGCDVHLDRASPLVHLDGNGLPMHGVPWAQMHWTVRESSQASVRATFDWDSPALLAVFPYAHRLEMSASIADNTLAIGTTVFAGPAPVPVSFGFHPYFGLPGVPRDQWRLRTPPMRQLVLDPSGIPTGERTPVDALDRPLAGLALDDGFEMTTERPTITLTGGGVRLSIEWVRGFRFAQIFAPAGKDSIAIEPMTAPTNALISARDLIIIPPGARFDAEFRVRVEDHR